ncbi:hypothetical protein ACFL35_13635 [Candidatus Riflebacteria bacterium]
MSREFYPVLNFILACIVIIIFCFGLSMPFWAMAVIFAAASTAFLFKSAGFYAWLTIAGIIGFILSGLYFLVAAVATILLTPQRAWNVTIFGIVLSSVSFFSTYYGALSLGII